LLGLVVGRKVGLVLAGRRRRGCSHVVVEMLCHQVEEVEVVENRIESVAVECLIEGGRRRMAIVAAGVDQRSRLLVELAGWRIGRCSVRSRIVLEA
jgi:hypothetical protein